MSGDHFEVSTATLRTVAGQLGTQAGEAGQIASQARGADVASRSWGLLGLGLGLYDGYTSARNTADESIGKVQSFLTDAQAALQSSAREYDQTDHAGGQLFDSIHGGLS